VQFTVYTICIGYKLRIHQYFNLKRCERGSVVCRGRPGIRAALPVAHCAEGVVQVIALGARPTSFRGILVLAR
jgi:hypothetical protein